MIIQILPHVGPATAQELVAKARATANAPMCVGHPDVHLFCSLLSNALLNDPRSKVHAELAPLGFWLRKSSIDQMIERCISPPKGWARAPLGIVFQLPPSNVDVLFLYSAVLSLLCGDVTLVRLSTKVRPVQTLLLEIVAECLGKVSPAVQQRFVLFRYGHDDEITTQLSLGCDIRLVWGGDETVSHIHRLPLSPGATDIGFSDRFSASALDAGSYLIASDEQKTRLIKDFYNDLYWFDQFACASPRLIIWVGEHQKCDKASADFYMRLSDHALAKGYSVDAAASLNKLNNTYLALHDLSVRSYSVFSKALSVLTLQGFAGLSAFKRVNYGFGLLLSAHVEALMDIIPHLDSRDQTLGVWGFSEESVMSFVLTSQGRGFDRVVPVGMALAFDPMWDGHNLFDLFTKQVRVSL